MSRKHILYTLPFVTLWTVSEQYFSLYIGGLCANPSDWESYYMEQKHTNKMLYGVKGNMKGELQGIMKILNI